MKCRGRLEDWTLFRLEGWWIGIQGDLWSILRIDEAVEEGDTALLIARSGLKGWKIVKAELIEAYVYRQFGNLHVLLTLQSDDKTILSRIEYRITESGIFCDSFCAAGSWEPYYPYPVFHNEYHSLRDTLREIGIEVPISDMKKWKPRTFEAVEGWASFKKEEKEGRSILEEVKGYRSKKPRVLTGYPRPPQDWRYAR